MSRNDDIVATLDARWREALMQADARTFREMLHPSFMAIHGPYGTFEDAERFLEGLAKRPQTLGITTLHLQGNALGGVYSLGSIQEMRVAAPIHPAPFTIQTTVTQVWVPVNNDLRLAHLQISRRNPLY